MYLDEAWFQNFKFPKLPAWITNLINYAKTLYAFLAPPIVMAVNQKLMNIANNPSEIIRVTEELKTSGLTGTLVAELGKATIVPALQTAWNSGIIQRTFPNEVEAVSKLIADAKAYGQEKMQQAANLYPQAAKSVTNTVIPAAKGVASMVSDYGGMVTQALGFDNNQFRPVTTPTSEGLWNPTDPRFHGVNSFRNAYIPGDELGPVVPPVSSSIGMGAQLAGRLLWYLVRTFGRDTIDAYNNGMLAQYNPRTYAAIQTVINTFNRQNKTQRTNTTNQNPGMNQNINFA